jgi:tetratricopeptide (TPR) repeat protein
MPASSMATLIVRHVSGSDPARFQVTRLSDAKTVDCDEVAPPTGFPVAGLANTSLMPELRWYLEEFLEYPFPPVTDRAEHVRDALRDWGKQAFEALFSGRADRWLVAATSEEYANLRLQIASDEPKVLAWPWEALYDPEVGFLAHTCQIERRLDKVRDPQPLPAALPTDYIKILLVTARPYDKDVRFRSVARPLVELIEKQRLPAHVDFLRPPTLARLRERLQRHKGRYHIVHFDGHGAYATAPAGGMSVHTLKGNEGQLVFEKEDGSPDPIPAETLSALLRDNAVPIVVLNACQSAMIDQQAQGPFASVATALLRAGTRSVVAMAYSLYVSGAQQFLPAFYRRLFEECEVARAVRAGRQEMLANPGRVCARGEFPLHDWLVPVVYQQQPLDLSFVRAAARAPATADASLLPKDLPEDRGFVGRDGPLLRLERALHLPTPAVLITGLGGVGKTTLARGFLQWLSETHGIEGQCFWFRFNEIRSAEFVLNRMGETFFGPQFATADTEKKIDALAAKLRERRHVIVWDNFELARGISGTSVTANLGEADCDVLARLLSKLRGGASKVIITSRSTEDWLGSERRLLVSLDGLDGEERWEYCHILLRNLGLHVNRDDGYQVELMELLKGHPLAMRVILPRLEKMTAVEVVSALKSNLAALGSTGDELERRLFATLRFAQDELPPELQSLLVPLALHENFVDGDVLEGMAKSAEPQRTREQIDAFLHALANAGLLRDHGRAIFEMHPVLTSFLQSQCLPKTATEARHAWERAFVDVMASIADRLAPLPLHKQRGGYHLHEENFQHALNLAEQREPSANSAALTQSLALYAKHTRSFERAAHLFNRLATIAHALSDPGGEAGAYHQLGTVAEERRDFAAAEQWYRKALAIQEKHGDEHGAASTYHQLGMVAQERRDLAAAEQWYRKALAIKEKHGNEHGAASTYRHLGIVAQERRDLAAAEQWYRKALAIQEKHGDEHDAAITYHQLGIAAQERRDLAAAEQWYRKALAIKEKHGNEHDAAFTYHQLGSVAQERRDLAAAEQWYRKALAIQEKHGDEHHAAFTYRQLGIVAQERRDLAAAEQWYRKALAIEEKHRNEHGAASTYRHLGIAAQERRDLAAAEQWYRKSLAVSEKLGEEEGTAATYHNLGMVAQERCDFAAAEQWYRKALAIKERLGDEHGAASTYHQLGRAATERRDFAAAEQWYRKALHIEEKQGNEHGAASTYCLLAIVAAEQKHIEASGRWFIQAIVAFRKENDSGLAQQGADCFLQTFGMATAPEQETLRTLWAEAGLGPFPKIESTDVPTPPPPTNPGS